MRNPVPTVDIIIKYRDGVVLIKRKNPPLGWALPGGYIDYGESIEQAAVREAKEETGLDVKLIRQFHAYSDPARDPRGHTITTVCIAEAEGQLSAGDDAKEAGVFTRDALPGPIVFDHWAILEDYFLGRH
jgi:ADP-ribose pyrophosphatase YjhB (NUDIX family)